MPEGSPTLGEVLATLQSNQEKMLERMEAQGVTTTEVKEVPSQETTVGTPPKSGGALTVADIENMTLDEVNANWSDIMVLAKE